MRASMLALAAVVILVARSVARADRDRCRGSTAAQPPVQQEVQPQTPAEPQSKSRIALRPRQKKHP